MRTIFCCCFLAITFTATLADSSYGVTVFKSIEEKKKERKPTYIKDTTGIPDGVMLSELIPVLYSGGERFEYNISWSGGIKIGEAVIDIVEVDKKSQIYDLKVRVTSKGGAFAWVYPVDDLHITTVQGPERLPIKHESWQKEGYGYEAHKVTLFDQEGGKYVYQNGDNPPREYLVDGKTHNEFSSFLASRLMAFETGKPFVVPTWADKTRVKVIVEVGERKKMKKTVLGSLDVVKVMPILTFSGTYDQRGDTTVWYSDDKCRIPVRVNSKIIIGSLTAKLSGWENAACELYPKVKK